MAATESTQILMIDSTWLLNVAGIGDEDGVHERILAYLHEEGFRNISAWREMPQRQEDSYLLKRDQLKPGEYQSIRNAIQHLVHRFDNDDGMWERGCILFRTPAGGFTIPARPFRFDSQYLTTSCKLLSNVLCKKFIYRFSYQDAQANLKGVYDDAMKRDMARSLLAEGLRIDCDITRMLFNGVVNSITSTMLSHQNSGGPNHVIEAFKENKRLKVIQLSELMIKRLGIPLIEFGDAGQFIQDCLNPSEKQMHDNFVNNVVGIDLAQIKIPEVEYSCGGDEGWTQYNHESSAWDKWEEYEVSKIVGHAIEDNGTYYYVHWRGYSKKERTWEPRRNVPASLIIEYEERIQGNRDETLYVIDTDSSDSDDTDFGTKDDDGDTVVDDSPTIKLGKILARDSSGIPDAHGAKPDVCIDMATPEFNILMKVEFMSEVAPREAEHLYRAMEYARQLVEDDDRRGFGVSFCIRGDSRFWVIVSFVANHEWCWYIAGPCKVESQTCGKRFSDVFLSFLKANRYPGGLFPDVEPYRIDTHLGFGGEANVFSAHHQNQELLQISRFNEQSNLTSQTTETWIVVQNLCIVNTVALKFWRSEAAYSKFQRFYFEIMQSGNTDHFMKMDFDDIHFCAKMQKGIDCRFAIDDEAWIALARWLFNFHSSCLYRHCDITPQNILFVEDVLMLSDWGSVQREDQPYTKSIMTTVSFFPEIMDDEKELYPSIWQDQLMFLRTVAFVGLSRLNRNVFDRDWPVPAQIPRGSQLSLDEFVSRVQRLLQVSHVVHTSQ